MMGFIEAREKETNKRESIIEWKSFEIIVLQLWIKKTNEKKNS